MIQTLSKKEIKEVNEKVSRYNISFGIKDRVQKVDDLLLQNNVPILFEQEERIYPTLKNKTLIFPHVYVDKGAIPFVVKGADLMRLGIKNMEEFQKDSLVFIADAEYKQNLALGIALFSSQDIQVMDKGKVIKNIHYVGDSIWNFSLKAGQR
jgi:PUA domain protein